VPARGAHEPTHPPCRPSEAAERQVVRRRAGERASATQTLTDAKRAPRAGDAALRRSIGARGDHGRRDDAKLGSTVRKTSRRAPYVGRGYPSVRQRRYHRSFPTESRESASRYVRSATPHVSARSLRSAIRTGVHSSGTRRTPARIWRNTRSVAVRSTSNAPSPGVPMSRCPQRRTKTRGR
jgi:hypothetical protein